MSNNIPKGTIEITDEVRPTRSDALMQTCYLHTGDAYPGKFEMYVPKGQAAKVPGYYAVDPEKVYLRTEVNGKYANVRLAIGDLKKVDLSQAKKAA